MNSNPLTPNGENNPSADVPAQAEGTGSDSPLSPSSGPTKPPTTARRITLVEYAYCTVVVLVIVYALSFTIRETYQASAKNQFKQLVRQIATAIHQYHDEHGSFPPAYTVGTDGRHLHSWRVLILPQLGYEVLYRQIRLDEPWDSPHNRQFHNQRPREYRHTYARDTIPGEAHMLAVVGRDTMWPEQYSAKMRDMTRGTSMTGMLLEHSGFEINWMEPRDLTRRDVRTVVFPAATNTSTGAFTGGVYMAIADGAVRFISSSIQRRLAAMLFSRDMENRALPGVDWPPEAALEMPELPPPRPASEFPSTQVMAHLNAKLDDSKNTIYCATMQIAWDELAKLAEGTPQFDRASDFVDGLNKDLFPAADLHPDSFVALSGRVSDGIIKKIHAALQRKFPHHPPPEIQASLDAIVAYSYLFKQLPFSVDFERFAVPLEFHEARKISKVEGFGIDSLRENGKRLAEILSQVQILDHLSDDDFILKLRTRERRDEIFLAKVKPGATLEETFKSVQKRIDSPATNGFRPELGGGDRLLIPVLQLSIDRSYEELQGLHFRNAALKGLFVSEARQIIKFRLDETGAVIESEAYIVGENGDSHVVDPYDPNKPRQLVFDCPFLLFVRETQAKAPYLVMWITNHEIMEKSQK